MILELLEEDKGCKCNQRVQFSPTEGMGNENQQFHIGARRSGGYSYQWLSVTPYL